VTSLIRENKFSELPGLLTTRERTRLFGEVEKEWKDIQRNNIDVEEQDIVSALPVRVLRHNVAYQRFADIDVVFVVHRVRDREVVDSPSIFMIIRVTFTRDYSKGSLPDWTISKFKVEKFSVLPKKWISLKCPHTPSLILNLMIEFIFFCHFYVHSLLMKILCCEKRLFCSLWNKLNFWVLMLSFWS